MSITLIRSNSDGVVHGADNDKLTGCRKRLQTMSSTREGEMKDIVDLTCDRCKEYFAKKMIRESNREESRIAKEEKKRFLRAKKQGIVSEATYEEYVINRESEASAKRDSKNNKNSESIPLKADLPENNYPSYQNYNQPAEQQPSGYSQQPYLQTPPIQSAPTAPEPQYTSYQSMSEQAAPVSAQNEEPKTVKPVQSNKIGFDDEFLAQFMVSKDTQESQQLTTESNPVKPVGDIMSAAKSAANDILSQLESDLGTASQSGKPISADASSFYSNQIPLVDSKSSTSSFQSVTNEFGTFDLPQKTSEKSSNDINDFEIPEVPSLHSYSDQKTTDDSPYINELTASVQNKISSSDAVNTFDSINHPNINTSIFDALDAVQASIGEFDNAVSSYKHDDSMKSAVNEFETISSVQPQMGGFDTVSPVQPQMGGFETVSPVQPQMGGFETVSPVQPQMGGFDTVSPVQPQMGGFDTVSPVQPQMGGFETVSPVQPQMGGFNTVSPVQPQMGGFNTVSPVQPQMGGFNTVSPVQPQMGGFDTVSPVQPQINKYKVITPVKPANDQHEFIMPPLQNKKSTYSNSDTYSQNNNEPLNPMSQNYSAAVAKISKSGTKEKTAASVVNQNHSPMVDSIEDALKQLGAGDSVKKENGVAADKEEIVPDFVAYVPSSSKVLHTAPPVNDYTASGPKRTMSAREAKKAAKIDAKFKKELMDRGFSQEEIKLQRRGK